MRLCKSCHWTVATKRHRKTNQFMRNAVTAALSKTNEAVEPPLQIQTITMNGFTILDDDDTPPLDELQRRFIVISPEDQRHEVVIQIETEALDYVERMTGRRLSPDNSFWTVEARRLLSDFLWNERGGVPPLRRLVLKNLDPDKLPIAARWRAEGMKGN